MEKFKHKFIIADKELKSLVEQELEVTPELKGKGILFRVSIPKYIYDKVVDSEPDYKRIFEHEHFQPRTKIKFRREISSRDIYDL